MATVVFQLAVCGNRSSKAKSRNYRPVRLTSAVGKLLVRIPKDRTHVRIWTDSGWLRILFISLCDRSKIQYEQCKIYWAIYIKWSPLLIGKSINDQNRYLVIHLKAILSIGNATFHQNVNLISNSFILDKSYTSSTSTIFDSLLWTNFIIKTYA